MTTTPNRQVLALHAKPGGNFLEVMSDRFGLHVNAWIGGTDPASRDAHYPPDGKWKGIGANLSDADARRLIDFLSASLDKREQDTRRPCRCACRTTP